MVGEEEGVSGRLERYVRERFDPVLVEDVLVHLLGLADSSGTPVVERIQAAAVVVADGDYALFTKALELARVDWRDLLIDAGLAHLDWREKLDDLLGPY
jgi:hypothetical protein